VQEFDVLMKRLKHVQAGQRFRKSKRFLPQEKKLD